MRRRAGTHSPFPAPFPTRTQAGDRLSDGAAGWAAKPPALQPHASGAPSGVQPAQYGAAPRGGASEGWHSAHVLPACVRGDGPAGSDDVDACYQTALPAR